MQVLFYILVRTLLINSDSIARYQNSNLPVFHHSIKVTLGTVIHH